MGSDNTHTHSHREGPKAPGVGNITHTQCNPDTPLSIRSIDYTGGDKAFQRVLSPLSLRVTVSSPIIWHVRGLFQTAWGKYEWWHRTRATSIYQETTEQWELKRRAGILSVSVQRCSCGPELRQTLSWKISVVDISFFSWHTLVLEAFVCFSQTLGIEAAPICDSDKMIIKWSHGNSSLGNFKSFTCGK